MIRTKISCLIGHVRCRKGMPKFRIAYQTHATLTLREKLDGIRPATLFSRHFARMSGSS